MKSKNKTEASKNHLFKAMQQLPSDFALREVRYHIGQALKKIGIVETKREKRETAQTQAKSWDEMLKTGIFNSNTPGRTIDVLNRLIDEEKKKLMDLQNVQKNDKGNDDVQTILG